MNKKVVIIVIGFVLITACGTNEPEATPTPTPDTQIILTETASAAVQTQQAASEATQDAADQATAAAISTADQATQAVKAAQDQTATATLARKATQDAQVKANKATADAFKFGLLNQANATSTAKMAVVVSTQTAWNSYVAEQTELLFDQGYMDEKYQQKHSLIALQDFDEFWAQRNWYQGWPIQLSPMDASIGMDDLSKLVIKFLAPEDFVIFSDVAWEMQDKNANLTNSGCGVIFAQTGQYEYNIIYLGLDGNAYLERSKNSNLSLLESGYYGKPSLPTGNVKVTLMNVDNRIIILVNGTKAIDYIQNFQEPGQLSWTLVSGTNKGKGMHCILTNNQIWLVGEEE